MLKRLTTTYLTEEVDHRVNPSFHMYAFCAMQVNGPATAAAAADSTTSSSSSVAQFKVVGTLPGTNSGDGTLSGTIHLRLQALTYLRTLLAQS